jgi:hypothetical protein
MYLQLEWTLYLVALDNQRELCHCENENVTPVAKVSQLDPPPTRAAQGATINSSEEAPWANLVSHSSVMASREPAESIDISFEKDGDIEEQPRVPRFADSRAPTISRVSTGVGAALSPMLRRETPAHAPNQPARIVAEFRTLRCFSTLH